MKTALLIVDIQNDYFPGGKMALEGTAAAGANAAALLAAFRRRRLPVVHVQHVAAHPGASFFLPDTEGVRIHECVAPLDGETVVQKHYPNSFRQTGLRERLQAEQAATLVLAGMMTHMCIDTTARAAFDLGLEVRLAHDACATKALSFGGRQTPAAQVQHAFVAALHGTFAQVSGTQDLLAALGPG